MHSKSFRRLKHKTQVFLAPEGDHYRTRLTHVLDVTQIARTIARIEPHPPRPIVAPRRITGEGRWAFEDRNILRRHELADW